MKKLLLIGALVLSLLVALSACDTGNPSETHTHDTTARDTTAMEDTPADSTEEPTEGPVESGTAPESEPIPEGGDESAPADTDGNATEAPTDTDTQPEETAPEETAPEEPEETGPGTLVYVSNDELRYLDNMGNEVGHAYEAGQYDGWTKRTITVGKDQVAVFLDEGWAAFDSKTYEFGYIVNGEYFFSDTFAREAEDAVVKAAAQKGAKNCARFCGGLTIEALRLGDNQVQFCVRLDGGVMSVLREYTVTLSQNPVRLDGSFWLVDMEDWEVSGHKKGITSASDPSHGGMVRAGGVTEAALLHQGAIGIGTVDLSKYSKIIVYYGCDNSGTTQDRYNSNPHNRIMLTRVDTDGMNSPEPSDIIAYETYALLGWTPNGLEIDLTGINYNGPVYITMDSLPGTFMLITAIEFIGAGKNEGSGGNDTPTPPPPPPAEGNYAPDLHDWEVSGHKPGITSASDPTHGSMVRAGGVAEAALLHQGAIGIGTVDLSKYSKVIIHYGCDNSSVTQNYYNNNPHNRIMLTKVDTHGMYSPKQTDIIASKTYALLGWTPNGLEIDLTGINYDGPVYVTMDTLPGTFMLITAIEFVE